VEADIVEKKKDYATGRVIEILEPSADRQEPYCPNYVTAGCCHWQHIRYDRQVEYKESILRETLRRVGHFDWSKTIERVTGPDRNYRLRATFHVINGQLGFIREDSNVIVPIRSCASLVSELNQYIGTVDPGPAREVHAISVPEVLASFVLQGGIVERSSRGTIHVDNFQYRVTADTFFQANRFLLAPLINEVRRQAGSSPGNVLDLYSGVGFFSIPMAQVAKEVIAIESGRTAVRLAQENATMNQACQLRSVEGQVGATLRGAGLRPNVVILDPPRAGCGTDTANQIAELKPDRIVYVSCNPATFAREASTFIGKGYDLRQITLVDQFPNTYHIELVASFDVR
jgi:23S rRNA (uracil1939-C5)-methyltransferase